MRQLMRPVHTTQPNLTTMLPRRGLGTGINPYSPMMMTPNGCEESIPPGPLSPNHDLPPNAPPVYFMPTQNPMNVMTPGANIPHTATQMYFHPPPSLTGYIPPNVASNPAMAGSAVPQRNDLHALHLGSDLFSYFPSAPIRNLSDIRATAGVSTDQIHLPAAQRGPTVYIGHLTPDTDDVIIRQLLQECGRVLRWSRTTDPATRKLSSFGFCEFESPLGVTRAVRCLNGLVLDGQPLVANCEDKVKEGMEQWRNDRKNKLQEENPAKSIQEIEQEIEREEIRTTTTTQRIAAEWNAKSSAQRQMVEEAQKPEPPAATSVPPPITPENSIEPHTSAVPSIPVIDSGDAKGIPKLSQRQQLLNALPGYVEIPPNVTLSSRESIRIRQWNSTIKDGRANFRKRCPAWERKEDSLRKDRLRARKDMEAAIENPSKMSSSQKRRLIEKDCRDSLYFLLPNGTVCEGPLSSRRTEERLAWLEKERDQDELDREAEKQELEVELKAEEERLREEEKELCKQSNKDAHSNGVTQPIDDSKETQSEGGEPPHTITYEGDQGDARDASAGDTTCVVSTEDTPTLSASDVLLHEVSTDSVPATLDLQFVSSKKRTTTREKPVVSSFSNIFNLGDEDDEDDGGEFRSRSKRPPLPLLPPQTTPGDDATTAKVQTEHQKQQLMMRLANQIPQKTEDLFAFPIDWELLKANKIFETKVTPWINKKLVEFLGEEEPELTILITTKLTLEPSANAFLEKLKAFFEDDAKGFTVKLWKMLVFEVLRLKQSASGVA